MAKIVEDENKKVYPKDPLDKNLLLTSIRDFGDNGVKLGVEKISRPFNKGWGTQISVQLTIVDTLEKCRMYELDEEGQYITETDDLTGETKNKIKIGNGHLATATLFLKVKCKDKQPTEDSEITLNPFASAYPLFAQALIDADELDEKDYGKSFATTGKELKEVLEGFTFLGKCETGTYNSKQYLYLGVDRLE